MTRLTILTGLTALAVLAFIIELLRRRQLQEKYAILWLTVEHRHGAARVLPDRCSTRSPSRSGSPPA